MKHTNKSNIESVQYCCSLDFVLSNNVGYLPVRRERLPFRRVDLSEPDIFTEESEEMCLSGACIVCPKRQPLTPIKSLTEERARKLSPRVSSLANATRI
jgi:hypothetical protein